MTTHDGSLLNECRQWRARRRVWADSGRRRKGVRREEGPGERSRRRGQHAEGSDGREPTERREVPPVRSGRRGRPHLNVPARGRRRTARLAERCHCPESPALHRGCRHLRPPMQVWPRERAQAGGGCGGRRRWPPGPSKARARARPARPCQGRGSAWIETSPTR